MGDFKNMLLYKIRAYENFDIKFYFKVQIKPLVFEGYQTRIQFTVLTKNGIVYRISLNLIKE